MSGEEFDFNDRYGIRPRRAWISYAVVCAILGGGWLVWSALDHSNPQIRTSLISFNNQDPRKVEVRYSVTRRDPNEVITCTLVARDKDKNTVGEIIDHIPLGVASITREVAIPTRLQAVNAAITSCTSL